MTIGTDKTDAQLPKSSTSARRAPPPDKGWENAEPGATSTRWQAGRFGSLMGWAMAHPVWAATVAAGVARSIAAGVGYGFHARDDYFHVLAPALRWLDDPSFNWDTSDLPGAGIRSHAVPRAVWLLLRGAHALGASEPETLLRLVCAVVGLYGLLVVPALYLCAKRLFDERTAAWAAWLGALHFAMPYAGTRLLIEAMAMVPLAWGLALAALPERRSLFFAGVCIGLSCWLRFQVGVAAIAIAAAIAWQSYERGGWRLALRATLALGLGGAAAVAAQGVFDILTTGTFLGPTLRNIAYNFDPPHPMTRSGALSYVGLFLLLTVPPASVILIPAMAKAGRRALIVSVPLLTFVFIHSLIGHKEERFMLPILPAFLVLLAAVPQVVRESVGPFWEWSTKVWPWTRRFLFAIHGLALVLAITAQPQANVRRALNVLRHDAAMRGLISLGPELHDFFLARPTLPQARLGQPDYDWLVAAMGKISDRGGAANRFLGFAPDQDTIEAMLITAGLICDDPALFEGYWLDRIAYRLNPRRNRRRSPVLIWHCAPTQMANRRALHEQHGGLATQPPVGG